VREYSRLTIRDRARRRADIVSELDRFPDAELNDEINASIGSLQTLQINIRGADYFEKLYYVISPATKSNPASPNIVASGAPDGKLTVVVTIVLGGALGTATFTWTAADPSTGRTVGESTPVLTTTAGTYALPETGLTLTFAAGTYVAGNTYTFTSGGWFLTRNQESYALPPDFIEASQVEVNNQQLWLPCLQFNKNERSILANSIGWQVYYRTPPMFRIRGDARYQGGATLDFAPVPDANYEVRFYYVPQSIQLSADSGLGGRLFIDNDDLEWLVCDVAVKCLDKDELEVGRLEARKSQIEKMFTERAQQRKAASPDRVTDESLARGIWRWGFGYGSSG
jgi:hypothetical protein